MHSNIQDCASLAQNGRQELTSTISINNPKDQEDFKGNFKEQTGLRIIKFQKILNNVQNFQKDEIHKKQKIINRSNSPAELKWKLKKEVEAAINKEEVQKQIIDLKAIKTIKKVDYLNQTEQHDITTRQNLFNNKKRPISPQQKGIYPNRQTSPGSKLQSNSPDFKLFECIQQIQDRYYEQNWGESCRILTKCMYLNLIQKETSPLKLLKVKVDEILKSKSDSNTLYKVRLNMIVQKLVEFLSIVDDNHYLETKLQIAQYALEKIFFINSEKILLMISQSKEINQKDIIIPQSKYGFYPDLVVQLLNIKSCILKRMKAYEESYTYSIFALQIIDYFSVKSQRHITLLNLSSLFGEEKKYQKALQFGKECQEECENLINYIKQSNEEGQYLNSEQLSICEVIKVESVCLFNMGIQLENLKKIQTCQEYLKKSYELIEQYKLTEKLQHLYFSFKNKYLEQKEKLLNQEKLVRASINSPNLSPISTKPFQQINNFMVDNNRIEITQSSSLKNILTPQVNMLNQTTNDKQFQNIIKAQINKPQLQLQKCNLEKQQSQQSPAINKEITNRKLEGARYSSSQKQIIQIYSKGLKGQSISPSSNSQQMHKQIVLKNRKQAQNCILHNTPNKKTKLKESSKQSEQNLETSKSKISPSKKENQYDKNFIERVANTLKVLDEELKVKRCNSLTNQNERSLNQKSKDFNSPNSSRFPQKSPLSRFKTDSNQRKQTNLDKLLSSHLSKLDKQNDKLEEPLFGNDLEMIKLEISWSSNSNYDDDTQNVTMSNRKEEIMDADKYERMNFLQIISQEIQSKEQKEKEKQDKIWEILKKIKARAIIRTYMKQKIQQIEANKKRLKEQIENAKQKTLFRNICSLKLYIHLMRNIKKRKEEREEMRNTQKTLVQTFVKIKIIQSNKYVDEVYFIKRVQVEGQENQKLKFYVTLLSQQNVKDRYSCVFTSEEILMNLNLNRNKNQPVHTINNIRQSFLTQVNPFIVLFNGQVTIDWNKQKQQNLENMTQNNVREDCFFFEESLQVVQHKDEIKNNKDLLTFLHKKNNYTEEYYKICEKTIQLQSFFRKNICQRQYVIKIQSLKNNVIRLKKGVYYDHFSKKYYTVLLIGKDNKYEIKSIDLQNNHNTNTINLPNRVGQEISISSGCSWIEHISFNEEGQLLYSNTNNSFISQRLKETQKVLKQKIICSDKLKYVIKIQSFIRCRIHKNLFKLKLKKHNELLQKGFWVQRRKADILLDEKCVIFFGIDSRRSKIEIKVVLQNYSKQNCLRSQTSAIREQSIQGYYSNEEIKHILRQMIKQTNISFDLKNKLSIYSPEIEILTKYTILSTSVSQERIKYVQNRMAQSKKLTKRFMLQTPLKNDRNIIRKFEYSQLTDGQYVIQKVEKAEKIIDSLLERSLNSYCKMLANRVFQQKGEDTKKYMEDQFKRTSSFITSLTSRSFFLNDPKQQLRLLKYSNFIQIGQIINNLNKLVPSLNQQVNQKFSFKIQLFSNNQRSLCLKRWRDINNYNFTVKAEQMNLIKKPKIFLLDFGFTDSHNKPIRCEVYYCKEDREIIILSNKLVSPGIAKQDIFTINWINLGISDHLFLQEFYCIRKEVMTILSQKLKYFNNKFSIQQPKVINYQSPVKKRQEQYEKDKKINSKKIYDIFPEEFFQLKYEILRKNSQKINFSSEIEYLSFINNNLTLQKQFGKSSQDNFFSENQFIFIQSQLIFKEEYSLEYIIDGYFEISTRTLFIIAYTNYPQQIFFIDNVSLINISPKLYIQVSQNITLQQTVKFEHRESIRNSLLETFNFIVKYTDIIRRENQKFSLFISDQFYYSFSQDYQVRKIQNYVRLWLQFNKIKLKNLQINQNLIHICNLLYLENKDFIWEVKAKYSTKSSIFYLEGFKIRREIEQEKRYIVFNIDLKKQQDIYSKISQKSSDIKSIKSILKAHSESLLENCIQIDLKKQTLNSKINQTQLILASVKKIQRLWRIKLSKDRLITLTKKKKRLQQNRNPIKKTILFKDFYYYQVLIYYNNKCFTIKAYQLPLQFLFSGSVQDIEENFRFCKEGETKIDYLLKRTSFNYNKQEIVFDLSENAVIQNQNSLSQIEAPRKQISYDLIVTYQNDKKNIQNYREISQSVENSALKDSIEENKIFQTSNKKKVGNNSLQSIKKHERKKTEEVIQVNVDLKKINKQYDPLSCGSNKNVSEAQIQEIVSEIAKSIQVFEDGSVIMDCLNSINSTAITIKKGLQNPSNYNSSQSFDNNKNFKSLVPCTSKVLKKGYLYSESKQRHTIFIKEWQEDQSSFLRIQTDQAYYECQKYYTIEVINQHSNNSINWRLSYYQFETLLYGSNLRDCSTTFERALFNFYKSFLIFQKTLIIEVDDDRDISILNNRPSQVLLLNKKHVRAFQSNVRVKLGAMKVNKARAEWNSLKSKIISQFLYRCEHQYLQNKEEDQYNNNTCYDQIQLITSPSLVQQQSEDQDNYQYFKFILYEKCDEKYFIKCWDLSNYSCFEKELKIKNLRQIFLLKLIDITPVVQQNTTINFHNISLEMSQFFNNQSEELSRNGQIQYYLNQFLIQIDLQRIKSEIKQAFKKQRQK